MLKLPVSARSHLLNRLIASLGTDAEIEDAWAPEAERRVAEVKEGKVVTVAGAEPLDRLRVDLR